MLGLFSLLSLAAIFKHDLPLAHFILVSLQAQDQGLIFGLLFDQFCIKFWQRLLFFSSFDLQVRRRKGYEKRIEPI